MTYPVLLLRRAAPDAALAVVIVVAVLPILLCDARGRRQRPVPRRRRAPAARPLLAGQQRESSQPVATFRWVDGDGNSREAMLATPWDESATSG